MQGHETQRVRRNVRRAVDIACEVITDRSEQGALLRCTNLTRHGARIESGIAPAEGEVVVISFHPPGRRSPLTLFARVQHIVKRGWAVLGFGFEFQGASLYERTILHDALRELPAQQRAPEHAA